MSNTLKKVKNNNYIKFLNFNKHKNKLIINNDKNKKPKENNNNNNNLCLQEKINWIEVYGYKGLDENMCANIIQEGIIPYNIKQTYELDNDNIITNYRGFHLSKELNGTFEKYDPLKHCKYFKVKATVDEKEWELIKSRKTFKDNIAAKKIELLEEISIDYKTLIYKYDYYKQNKECQLQNVFPTKEKWLKFYNSNIDFHEYIIKENFNILKSSKCKFSDSIIKIILNKIENKTINRYKNMGDLERNILIYIYTRRIIDLILLDNISKETILKLLCDETLF